MLRIAVIGDFHIQPQELHITEAAMEDITASKPDLVVPLGDFGSNDVIGSIEGLDQAYRYIRAIGAPLRPILGNHDLQRESGPGIQPKGTIERALLDLYSLDSPYGVLDLDNVRLFFISTEPQPPENCYQIQECYVSDTQFSWFQRALAERPGVPCIVFSHAPPIGSGLRTVPNVHVRATNAYLDQNHDPYRWLELIRSTPEIVVWLSAHYHLGHEHPDSSTVKYGTYFFTTGVHAGVTRDGNRQSRMIELENGRVRIFTLDHIARKQASEANWNGGSLRELVKRKRNALLAAKTTPFKEAGAPLPIRIYACSVGGPASALRKVLPLSDSRCLVVADDGFLWETDFQAEAVLGTLHLGEPLSDAAVAEDGVWRAWGNSLFRSDPHNLRRFHRDASAAKLESPLSFKEIITFLSARQGGGVWVGCGRELYEVPPECIANPDRASDIQPVPVLNNESGIDRLFEQDGRLRWVNNDRQLLTWDRQTVPVLEDKDIAAWDMLGEAEAGISHSSNGMYAFYRSTEANWTFLFDSKTVSPDFDGDIVCLGQGFALLMIEGKAQLWDAVSQKMTVLDSGPGKVTSISRAGTGTSDITFCLTTAATELQLPQLQIWRCGKLDLLPVWNGRGAS
jgi:predicted phosphodiesterase